MSSWIPLHFGSLSQVDAGPRVTAFRSPFDVPTAMRATYDQAKARIRVEFRYISGEERTHEVTAGEAICNLGVHSGRVYAITIDLTQENATVRALSAALKRLEHEHRRSARNYEAAEKAVSENQDLLLAAV